MLPVLRDYDINIIKIHNSSDSIIDEKLFLINPLTKNMFKKYSGGTIFSLWS